jgi:predicted alpha/beta hydrolase
MPADNPVIQLRCRDGMTRGGQLWPASGGASGSAIINPVTGVLAPQQPQP